MNEKKECSHQWVPVPQGKGMYNDECMHCGAVGYLDWDTGEIKAGPKKEAKVISLCEFRKTGEIKDAVETH